MKRLIEVALAAVAIAALAKQAYFERDLILPFQLVLDSYNKVIDFLFDPIGKFILAHFSYEVPEAFRHTFVITGATYIAVSRRYAPSRVGAGWMRLLLQPLIWVFPTVIAALMVLFFASLIASGLGDSSLRVLVPSILAVNLGLVVVMNELNAVPPSASRLRNLAIAAQSLLAVALFFAVEAGLQVAGL